MELIVKYHGKNAIVRVTGNILGDDRTQLHEKLQEVVDDGAANVILNLKNVGLMDSVGLGMLVALQASLNRRNVRLILSDVGRSVEYLLIITKLSRIFKQYTTEDDALAALEQKPRV